MFELYAPLFARYGVAWPAQNMPVSYFDKFYPWSVSMGSDVDESTVKVTLTRVADGRTWTFGADSADGVGSVQTAVRSAGIGNV